MRDEYEKSAQEYTDKFRVQSRTQKENIAIIKDQYKKVQEIYSRKMQDMQEKLAKETKKMEIAEKRRKLELEGYGADLSAMKKKIQFFQKFIGKIKRAVDDDRGEQGDAIDMSEDEDQNQDNRVSERSNDDDEEGNEWNSCRHHKSSLL